MAITYADDIVLVISTSDRMQLALRRVSCCRLNIMPDKTKVILFMRRYKPLLLRPLKLIGAKLKLKYEEQFLGVMLDRKLTVFEILHH